jgi:hypothetical protein
MNKRLWIGLLFDAIGMLSFFFPVADVVWAPLSAYLMIKMYPGATGKIAGLVSFLEEAIPGLDFFPSFTLTWLYYKFFVKDNST